MEADPPVGRVLRARQAHNSCAAAGGDVPGQGFHWAPAVTAAVAGTLSAPVQGEKHIYTLGVTAPARMQINTRISNQYR